MDKSNPNVVERLKKLPPYDDVVNETPQDAPETVVDDPSASQDQINEEVVPETVETPTIETTNERTKEQFNKLTESNKALKQENEQLKKKNVVESLRPEPVITPQVQFIPQVPQYNNQQIVTPPTVNPLDTLVDEDGYVDTKKLQELARITKEANERAARAEQQAKETESRRMQDKRDFEETQQMREIHKEYPELDPNGPVFDATLFDAVRNELVSQYTRGENDILNAVKKWHSILIKPMNKQDAQKKAEQKSQIQSTTPPSANRQPTSQADIDSLRKGTMFNVKGSLAERLRRAGQ